MNYGYGILDSVSLQWEVNGVAQPSVNFKNELLSGADVTVMLGSFPFVSGTPYSIMAYTENPNGLSDTCTSNDTVAGPMTIFPQPHVDLGNDTAIIFTTSITLDAGPGFDQYLWSTGDTTQSIQASPISVPSAILYWVDVADSNGCSSSDTIIVYFVIGIDETPDNHSIQIFPNPTTGKFYLEMQDHLMISNIAVFDLNGRQVYFDSEILSSEICVQGLEKGIYVIRVATEEGLLYGKIIVDNP